MIVTQGVFGGVKCLVLDNDYFRITILPERGGNIASMYDKEAGYELLCQPAIPLKPIPQSKLFDDGSRAGIDDMFPNALATVYDAPPFSGLPLPDHGEIWYRPMEPRLENGSIALDIEGTVLPYHFIKWYSLEGRTLKMQYRAKNKSNSPLHYLFAAHPMFKAADDARIYLPEGQGKFEILFHDRQEMIGGRFIWQEEAAIGDAVYKTLSDIGVYTKIVSRQPQAQGWCTIWQPQRQYGISVEFDQNHLPFIGIWCGLSNERQHLIAPEPSTHQSVDLARRGDWDTGRLSPKEEHKWRMSYTAGKADLNGSTGRLIF